MPGGRWANMGRVTEVSLHHVSVRRNRTTVLDDVSLQAEPGTLTVVVGPSGAGKTSLLRTIAGLDPVSSGSVRFDGADVTTLGPRDRNTSFTFQEAALLTTRTVERNIAMPLEIRRETAERISDRVGVEARVLHIDHLLRRDVGNLSVGEAQMVQIARSLVHLPDVLLLDEPFAAIEGERSAILRREIRHLQREFGVTAFVTTNDPADIRDIADQVVVLERGRAVQIGSYEDVFTNPNTAASAVVTGDATVERVTVERDGNGAWLVHPAFRVRAWAPVVSRHAGRHLLMVTRPEWWSITAVGDIEGTVERAVPWAATPSLVVDVSGHRLTVRGTVGDGSASVRLELRHWVLLDPLDGFAIR